MRYGLPSGMSVKTTNPRRPPPRYIKIIHDGRLLTVRRTISRKVIVDTTAAPALYIIVSSILDRCVAF